MKLRSLRALTAAPMLVAAVLSAPAMADQLTMKHGDVITGEIEKIEDGELFIEPAYGSEFSVDLAEIASIEADQVFEIELENGDKVEATFAGGADGNQTIAAEMLGPPELELPQLDASEPKPILR